MIGSISGPDGKIPNVVTVPYSPNLMTLTPVVTHTGVLIAGGGIPTGGPGAAWNFTGPVAYTGATANITPTSCTST